MREEFEEDMSLLSFYSVIDSLYKNDNNDYPADVKKKMESLLNELDKYISHKKTGYKIVDEKFTSKITFYQDDSSEKSKNKKCLFSLFRK